MKQVIDDKKEKIKATKEFTDREEPRQAFWNNYNRVKESKEIRVVSYYGYGGIGKSALLKQLIMELKERESNSKYEFINFDNLNELNNNTLDILKLVRQDLKSKYNFTFPIFDLVVYTYDTKMGRIASKPELESIFDENKELGFLMDVAEDIPLIGTVTKIISYADRGKNLLKNRLENSKLKTKLLELENMTSEEIKNNLSYYFALDLKENIKDLKAPFVFFIDTYEKLVNEFDTGNSLSKDLWLRGEDGLIQRLPNTLWVIAGQQKLKWDDIDKEWEDSIEQHILGVLDFKDAKYFLNKAGIEDEGLVHDIYNITHGNPYYLDLCVDIYEKVRKTRKPTINDFDNDTGKLLNRLFAYLGDNEKDFVITLAFIGSWQDSDIESKFKSLDATFSYNLYEKIKTSSFIINEDNTYRIYEDAKNIIINNAPKILKNKYKKRKNEERTEEIKRKVDKVDREEKPKNDDNHITINYSNKQEYSNIIHNLFLDLYTSKNNDEFDEKAEFLLNSLKDYENKYYTYYKEDKVELIDNYIGAKYYKEVYQYYFFNLTEAIRSVDTTRSDYYLKRYIKYTTTKIDNENEYNEYKELLNIFKDNALYRLKIVSLIKRNIRIK